MIVTAAVAVVAVQWSQKLDIANNLMRIRCADTAPEGH